MSRENESVEARKRRLQSNAERRKRNYHKAKLDPARYAAIRKDRNERNARCRQWLAEYKVRNGCADCGYNGHPAALQFDHVRGDKLGNIACMQGLGKVQVEVLKCDVVCANCHAIRTHVRQVEALGVDYISHFKPPPASSLP